MKKEKKNINSIKEEIRRMKSDFQQKEENNTNSMNIIKEEINKTKMELFKIQEENINSLKEKMNKVISDFQQKQEENKKKEEEIVESVKEEIRKTKSEFQKKHEENTKKEEDNLNSIKEEISKITTEFQKHQSENVSTKDQKSLTEELNQIKTFLNRMQTSMLFDNDICREEFNKIDGETQISLIDEMRSMKNDSIYENIENLLIHLSKEYNNSKPINNHSNYIYIPSKINDNDQASNSIIEIGYSMTEILFLNGKLKSNEFSNFIQNFSEFHIEIMYPSVNFNPIFDIVKRIKNNFRSKLKISIFITGVKKTNQNFLKKKTTLLM